MMVLMSVLPSTVGRGHSCQDDGEQGRRSWPGACGRRSLAVFLVCFFIMTFDYRSMEVEGSKEEVLPRERQRSLNPLQSGKNAAGGHSDAWWHRLVAQRG